MTNLGYVSDQSKGQLCLSNRQLANSLFGPFTYPWGPRDRGLLSSLRIKESKALGCREPAAASGSKEHFACFPLKVQKALWRSSTRRFFPCLSLIISQLVTILGESYKWIIFPRQSFYDRKVSFQVGASTMLESDLSSVFQVQPSYTGKNHL